MMARLVIEDSDDEFPDLTTLISSAVPKPLVRKASTVRKSWDSDETKTKEKTTLKVLNDFEIADFEGGKVKVKPKKRILKKTTENPLLRPFTSMSAAASEEFSGRKQKSRVLMKTTQVTTKILGEAPRFKDIVVEEKEVKARRGWKEKAPARFDSDSEDDETSSFIVEDESWFLDGLEEEVVEKKPPKNVRRLVKGRRASRESSPESPGEQLEREMLGLTMEEDSIEREKDDLERAMKTLTIGGEKHLFKAGRDNSRKMPESTELKKPKSKKEAAPKRNPQPLSSGLEDPFTLSFSSSDNKPRKVSNEARFMTPPGSPDLKPKGLRSPTKKPPRVPDTPHRQTDDAFWSQDVVNDWNDEYSPQKQGAPLPKSKLFDDDVSEGALLFSPIKKGPVKQNRAEKDAKKSFAQKKVALAESFLTELDAKITGSQVAALASSTGGIKIIWSKKLNTTAGRANWKRETIRSSIPGKPPTYRHHAAIELAEKVIDDEDRLLNVLAHEFCHLANFMISNIKTNPHGREFKAWASQVSHAFKDRGIEVTTKHSYAIDYKYVWECENCGLEFKRHSKSIDPSRHQCGKCKYKLIQTKPVPKATTAKVSEYQMFVKENMKRIREENPGSPQKEIMGLVGKRYQEFKAAKLGGIVGVGVGEKRKEGTPDPVEVVVRKLDFFKLTSP